jgi:homoserine O-succinyltransferase
MPIRIPVNLPAYDALCAENVFVMSENRAAAQDIRPLKVAILNLMPTTVDTETQLLRLLSNTPLQVDITLIRMGSHESRHAPPGHLDRFYVSSDAAMRERFDGLIVTGAPVETLDFEAVDYWPDLAALLDYSAEHVFSTLHICWGAQAGLYRRYGIPKRALPKKLQGIFAHAVASHDKPLFRGFDDEFLAPQSRHTESDPEAIAREPRLTIESRTPECGVFLATARGGREVYVSGHLEYDRWTLDREYKRDRGKGIPLPVPVNYYPGDDPAQKPLVHWRAHAHLFFSNWVNFVYQETPYRLADLDNV